MKRIWMPVDVEPWRKYESGEKTVEIRNEVSPVARQVLKDPSPGRAIEVALGQSGVQRRWRVLGRVYHGPVSGLPDWVRRGAAVNWTQRSAFFDAAGTLVCFEVLPGGGP